VQSSAADSGACVGATDGARMGATEGAAIGDPVGASVGASVDSGACVGATDGARMGATEGATVGDPVGASVGASVDSRSATCPESVPQPWSAAVMLASRTATGTWTALSVIGSSLRRRTGSDNASLTALRARAQAA